MRHGKNAAIMMLIVAGSFALNLPAWSASAGASWATTLNHKVWKHAVKVQAVIETFFGKLLKIGHGKRCVSVEELDEHVAFVCFDGCG